MKLKKIMVTLVLSIMLMTMVSIPVLAVTNEKVILKNSDNEYLIYYKEFCSQEFQFAISTDQDAKEEDLSFTKSAKDKPETSSDASNVAYIDKTSFESIFGKNPTSLVAYVWVKNAEGSIEIKADQINLNNALTDEMITLVNTTTKANESTDRIEVDTTKSNITHPEVEGIEATLKTGKIVIKEKENAKYYYSLVKVSDENTLAKEMYELAEKMQTNQNANTYEKLTNQKRFYELYEALIPSSSEWKEVKDSEILQPESARTGDKFIAYIKEENGQETLVDAKLLVSQYEYEERRVNEDDKVVTETVKLPVTFDSGAILFTVLGVIVVALIVFVFIRKNSDKKDENK